MGELLLCHEPMAAEPYLIEESGMHLYSLEELSFYIANNVYLLDGSFMKEELCLWIEIQTGHQALADTLREALKKKTKLSDFVLIILEDCAYCNRKEQQEIVFAIRQMELKSDFECRKIRADKLMEKEKFLAAIYEYKRLLHKTDAEKEGGILLGNIWHNLGTAYARLFLFAEAKECCEQAYHWNENMESLRECLMCCYCMQDQAMVQESSEKYHVDHLTGPAIENELSLAKKGEELNAFKEKLNELEQRKDSQKAAAKSGLDDIICQWKKEYRRSCKV